ncbi:MAG TPA: TIGR00730 family Rossman fold protein [Stellaceae bacterium]|nr:TIGR00730 family Rossman fold protein [Stellaceae bacterium]
MSRVKRLCVYCGSSGRVAEEYREAARRTGTLLAKAGIELVYGGGRVGLMGLMADAAIAAGGRVIGIIPDFLHTREVAHPSVSELIVVSSMHERKQRMFELSDAFAILPGGLGTLDEAFECLTWRQLGLHDEPILLVDVGGYWAPLLELIDRVIEAGFARPKTRALFEVVPDPEALVAALKDAPEPALAPATRRV